LSDFYAFCASGNSEEYYIVYLLNGWMTSYMRYNCTSQNWRSQFAQNVVQYSSFTIFVGKFLYHSSGKIILRISTSCRSKFFLQSSASLILRRKLNSMK